MIELPPFDGLALSIHHRPGVQALLVGSGLSRASGIPTGWEVTLDLIRRLAALDGVLEHDNWEQWYREKYDAAPNYSEILDALGPTPDERRAILQSYVEPGAADDARTPTKAHHAIAGLVSSGAIRIIITTNFDRLIEQALREAGIEPTVIASDDAINGATPLMHTECTVIKVHGDYLDARIKNTEAELSEYSPDMNALLDQVFDNFGLVVVGWSGEWDMALRSAVLRAPSRRYPLYWAARGAPRPLAQELLDHRDGRSIPITDGDSFFVKLRETLAALEQANRPHPQSIDIAIALAKRYSRDDKFTLEWAEFIRNEVEEIRDYVTGTSYPNSEPTPASLNGIIDTFMNRTEVLRRAFLICGRWGTPNAIKTMLRSISPLTFTGIPGNSWSYYLALRNFGASVCFYWAITGLIARNDWTAVRELMHLKIRDENIALPAVSHLSTGGANDIEWSSILSDYAKKWHPVSEYLFHQISEELRDIAVVDVQAEELFDQVELLISLEAAHLRLQEMKENNGLWFWVPVGRYVRGTFRQNWPNDLARYESMGDEDAIYTAGLLGGDNASAKPTFEKLREYLAKL